jgi:capsular exopolysaccharide synthesis family protein
VSTVVRAHCPHCGTTETYTPDEVYSPEFSFWCPRCQNIRTLESEVAPPAVAATSPKADDGPRSAPAPLAPAVAPPPKEIYYVIREAEPAPVASSPRVGDVLPLPPPPPLEPRERDALDEVPMIEAVTTRGSASRAFDATLDRPPRSSGTFRKPPVPVAPPTTATPPTSKPRPTSSHSFASGDDLDWYALIDKALPETAPASNEGTARVVIRLPEAMAPRTVSDGQPLREMQAALEARGIAETRRVTPDEPRSDASAPPSPSKASELEVSRADPHATASLTSEARGATAETKRSSGRLETPPLDARPANGETKRSSGRLETPSLDARPVNGETKRSSGRFETPPLDSRETASDVDDESAPAPGMVVEQFNSSDLDPSLVCARDPSSPEADDFRQLYQMIFHARPGGAHASGGFGAAPRIVLVTSARRGEGKTTVAANLAVVAARMPGRGALLIGADPRGGDLLRVFGLSMRREGLLEALEGSQDPKRLVMKFKLGNLDVLPLGVPGSDAAELISSDRLGEVLHGLAARYPTASVIVDGSSVLHAPDPLALARQVDGVVLVVRADETPREDVERARDLLGAERVLGVVLNHVAAGAI